jgi:hypothetical protein
MPLAPIATIEFTADGGVLLDIPEGETAGIEFSTDLIDWQRIGETSGTFQDDDESRQDLPAGYYRTVRD